MYLLLLFPFISFQALYHSTLCTNALDEYFLIEVEKLRAGRSLETEDGYGDVGRQGKGREGDCIMRSIQFFFLFRIKHALSQLKLKHTSSNLYFFIIHK